MKTTMILFRNTLLMTKELKMRYGCQFWRSGYQINNYTILTTCSNLPKQMIYYSYIWSYKNYDANRWNLDMHGLSQTISKMSARIGINQLNILMGVGWISSHAVNYIQDDVIKWKHFPRYWQFVREFTGPRWIPHTKVSDAELWCFLWCASE